MVSLSKVVLNIIILCRNAQLDELVLECSGLLKEAVYFAFNLHNRLNSFSICCSLTFIISLNSPAINVRR